jgi:hypothetical protein
MESQANKEGRSSLPSSAVGLSLAGGIIIIISTGLMPWLFFANYYHQLPYMDGGMMMWWFLPFFWPIPLISGIMVISGAIVMSKRPREASIWAIVVLVFSVLALVGMGLSIVGSILGIFGGIIVLSNGAKHNIV